jgi:cell division protein ZapA (FtsZ GTPase activity inhibitor)
MSKISINVPELQKQKLKDIAEKLDISLSELMRDWVSQVLAALEAPDNSQ